MTKTLLEMYDSDLDTMEKNWGLDSGIAPFNRISSGLLSLDMQIGGGWCPGMNTLSGKEKSGKTTIVQHTLDSALRMQIPVNLIFDPEGAVTPDYTSHILHRKLTQVFGSRDRNGKWLIRPLARYYPEQVIETVFLSIQEQLRRMPDKRYIPSSREWFLVYDDTKQNRAKLAEMKLNPDKKLLSKTGRLWIPTDNGNPQAFISIDSYAAMDTNEVSEGKDDNSLAMRARAFSKYIGRVKGLLRYKGVVLLGTNQIRDVPMAMFGPKENEVGGNALQQYSDVRFRCYERVVPKPWERHQKNASINVEDSLDVEGRIDRYQHKVQRNVKNKVNTPYTESWGRVWMSDSYNRPHGFDPVYDVYNYLRETQQLEGSITKQLVLTPDKSDPHLGKLHGTKLDWHGFKLWALAEYRAKNKDGRELNGRARKHLHRLADQDIRVMCRKQLRSGRGVDMFLAGRDGVDTSEDLED